MVLSTRKKRKSSTFLQSPWHKVYLQGSELCHNIRIAEQEWSLATNTLSEKLLQPAPKYVFLGDNAALNYEMVLYFVSRINLANSCSLKCRSDLDKSINRQTSKTASDQDQQHSLLVNAFNEKIQKLERDFESLKRTTSILDTIFEIQDLERFSMINHLGKFHNRAKTFTRPIPQKYAVAIQMPMNLPEPLHCLPL
ncbi:hypothetical protein AtNW77_Chr3g0190671 [Arabidopsis thaliana]